MLRENAFPWMPVARAHCAAARAFMVCTVYPSSAVTSRAAVNIRFRCWSARHGEWDKPDYFIGGGMILLEGYCGESLAGLCLPNLRESSGTSGGLGPGCKSSRFHIFLRPC